jgi:hypothetical protein
VIQGIIEGDSGNNNGASHDFQFRKLDKILEEIDRHLLFGTITVKWCAAIMVEKAEAGWWEW